jgi:RNA polymerase sigma-70 factor (ECF subfamily)
MIKLFVNEICEQSIRRISEGDLSALSVIYDCTGRLIFTVAYSILGDYQLAQDAMQETFVKIADNASTYKKGTNAKAWIVSIVRNLALNMANERKKYAGFDTENIVYPFPEDNLIDSIALSEALSHLTAQEREIVVYKTVCNMRHKEIGRILDISVDNCRQKYKRALEKLRNFYNEEGGKQSVPEPENQKKAEEGF